MQVRPPSVPVRWAIGIIGFVLILAWFTAPNPIDTASGSDPFVGRWLINGVDPFGVEYSGSLSITASGGEYALEWIVTGALVSGTGQLSGDELRAGWRRTAGNVVVDGTAEYRIDDPGILQGTVTIPGVSKSGHESGERVGG
jgi:hypothetical protein